MSYEHLPAQTSGKVSDGAAEVLAIVKGDQSAARITIHGHTYVPLAVAQHESDCVEAAKAEIERLRRDCAELYQVIGTMAEHCPDPSDPAIVKALDNASDAANGDPRRHDDLLPFILPPRASCAECDCKNPPSGCNWIKPADGVVA